MTREVTPYHEVVARERRGLVAMVKEGVEVAIQNALQRQVEAMDGKGLYINKLIVNVQVNSANGCHAKITVHP